jgi:hypothetical protein
MRIIYSVTLVKSQIKENQTLKLRLISIKDTAVSIVRHYLRAMCSKPLQVYGKDIGVAGS